MPSSTIGSPLHATLLLTALATAAGLTGCSSVEVQRDPAFDFTSVRSFAWKEAPQFAAGVSQTDPDNDLPDPDAGVLERLQRLIERDLARRGIVMVEKQQAQVVLSATLRVENALHHNDPNYTIYVAEEYEVGVLTLEMFDRLQRKSVWVGEQKQRLRTIAHAFGGIVPRFVDTDERRNWAIDELAQKVLQQLPATAPTGSGDRQQR